MNQLILQEAPSGWRYGQVPIVAKHLGHDLTRWAYTNAVKRVSKEQIGLIPTFQIDIKREDGGYTSTLFYDEGQICSLHSRKTLDIVDLYLPKEMPVGPWDENVVTNKFKNLRPEKILVTPGLKMPKISTWKIEPWVHSFNEKGFSLDIWFDDSILFGSKVFEEQTDLIVRALDTGLESSNCCHFFKGRVCIFFPNRIHAIRAEKRVEKICS